MKDLNTLGLTKKQVAETLLTNIKKVTTVYVMIQKYLKQVVAQEEMKEMGVAADAMNDPENMSMRKFPRISPEQLEKAWDDYAEFDVFLDSFEEREAIAKHMSKYIKLCTEGLADDKFVYSKRVVEPRELPCVTCPKKEKCDNKKDDFESEYLHQLNMMFVLKEVDDVKAQKELLKEIEERADEGTEKSPFPTEFLRMLGIDVEVFHL